ncbi:hypothetical protein BC826DRAFT_990565 [Russula brevipes]|nr:hypothetical protein BC826DRAFT_990565 [Russula brevipes]
MVNDPKSAHFISWTELGTRYAPIAAVCRTSHALSKLRRVSNVGEFSRTILGSPSKHDNVSLMSARRPGASCSTGRQFPSFVRQLNVFDLNIWEQLPEALQFLPQRKQHEPNVSAVLRCTHVETLLLLCTTQ